MSRPAPRWPSRRRLMAFATRTLVDFLELVDWPDQDDEAEKPRAHPVRPAAKPEVLPTEIETARARAMLRRKGITQ